MAIATKTKPKTVHHKKRVAEHHRQNKHYVRSYWPYLPMLAIVIGGAFINTSLSRPHSVLGANTTLTSQVLTNDTNVDRMANKESALTLSGALNDAAQAKATDMVQKNYWSHVTPSGQQPWSFITTAGYQYQTAGENLAYGFYSASDTLNAWMHSPEHRANILDSTYTQVGFGVAQSPNFVGTGPETVIVAMYARPASAVIPGETSSRPLTSVNTQPVSRIQAVGNTPTAGDLVVALIGSVAILVVLVRHGIAWRKLVNRGELFVIQHPALDLSLITLAMIALILNHSVGFIG